VTRDARHLRITQATLRQFFAVALAAALLLPASARGDAVPPPPTDCPEGSEGGTGHCGTYCMPRTCSDQAACATGTACKETKFCIEQKTCSGGKPTPYDYQIPPYVRDEVKGSCVSAACSTGTCRSISVCLPKTASGDSQAATARGCSCGLAEAGGGGAALSLLLALGLVASLQRKRRAGR
jgi:hypothetical protein